MSISTLPRRVRFPLALSRSVLIALLCSVLLLLPAMPATAAGESGSYSPTFTVGGMVATQARYGLVDLQALPATSVSVQFRSGAGLEEHTYTGVRLYDLLMAAGPQFDSARKNDKLDWFVHVRAGDGYEVVLAWGELDPDWEAKDVLVAYEDGGQLLGSGDGMARLVVPGDIQGGRYVSSITAIDLLRPAE